MSILNYFKRSEQKADPYELLESMGLGSPTASGQHVNSNTAQSLPSVYCAVATIAEAIASMPIHVFRRGATGKERLARHNIERLLNSAPNAYQTAYDFKISMLRAVLLRGNAFALINFDGSGKPSSLRWLHPDSVRVEMLTNGRLGYTCTGINGKVRKLLQEEVLHIKHHSDDGILGKSPITVCREAVGIELASLEHGAETFKNAARLSGIISTPSQMGKPSFEMLKKAIKEGYTTKGNRGKALVIPLDIKYQQLSMSNQDAEWIESRKLGISEIARMFKISPIFLMDYSNSTYSNFSEASRAFVTQTLRPWLSNIQEGLASRLISDSNRSTMMIEFETKDLMRASAEERFKAYDIAIRMGFMNPNECRAAENMPPREGGELYSQSWMQQDQAQAESTEQKTD